MASEEVANVSRVTTYGAHCLFEPCPCPALEEETYVSPSEDPAPWYDAAFPESADFWGFLPQSINISPAPSRSVTPVAGPGSNVGTEKLSGRVVEVIGWMIATDSRSMWWGERWLTETLRGNRCTDGCNGDELTLLTVCRDDEFYGDYASDFRTMVRAGLVDGPRWAPVSDDPFYIIQTAQFQITTAVPWLYHPADRCIDSDTLQTPLACSLTTPEWGDGGTFVIDITNEEPTVATDITITGQISLDGDCPVSGLGTSVPPSFVYTIPSLGPEDRIVIDGQRRQARYYDASCKSWTSALPFVDFVGPWVFPDAGVCTTMCVVLEIGGGEAVVTVDAMNREL
jgi:hypothetical protein